MTLYLPPTQFPEMDYTTLPPTLRNQLRILIQSSEVIGNQWLYDPQEDQVTVAFETAGREYTYSGSIPEVTDKLRRFNGQTEASLGRCFTDITSTRFRVIDFRRDPRPRWVIQVVRPGRGSGYEKGEQVDHWSQGRLSFYGIGIWNDFV